MKQLKRKGISIILALFLSVGLFAAAPLAAYADDVDPADSYDDGDVAIINEIIANNGLTSWASNAPADWPVISSPDDIGVAWTDDVDGVKRIQSLRLPELNLTGTMNLAGLTSLYYLDCHSNAISALNISDNPSLAWLWCSSNQLAALDVSLNSALQTLLCDDNQLTGLDVSNNSALTSIYCYDNSMPQNLGYGVTGIDNVDAFTAWGSWHISFSSDFVYSPQNGPMLTAPSFSAHPATQTVPENATLTFTAAASGNPAPTLYWEVSVDGGVTWSVISDGGIYSGAASAALTLTGTPLSYNAHQYRCIATNSEGLVASNAAILTVNSTPTIEVSVVRVGALTGQENLVTATANVQDAFSQSVEVKLKDDAAAVSAFTSLLGENNGRVIAFDISLYLKDTDTKTHPNAGYAVAISIPLPSDLVAVRDTIQIGHITGGKLSVLPSGLVQKAGVWYIVFETNSFSPYALLAGVQIDTGSDESSTPTPTQTTVPQTGDNTNTGLWAMLLLASGLALAAVIIWQKRRRRKNTDNA